MEAGLIQTVLRHFSFPKINVPEFGLSMFDFDKKEVSEAFFEPCAISMVSNHNIPNFGYLGFLLIVLNQNSIPVFECEIQRL